MTAPAHRGKRFLSGGYVALVATVITGLVLLAMVAEEGLAGMHARFNVLGTENKERATTLAEGCLDQGMARLLVDPSAADAEGALPGFSSGDSSCTYAYQIGALDANGNFSTSTLLLNLTGTVTEPGGATVTANLQAVRNVSGIKLGSRGKGILVVQVVVGNNNDVKKVAEDFSVSVAGNPPPLVAGAVATSTSLDSGGVATSTFRGSIYGTVVYVPIGSTYNVQGIPASGYQPHFLLSTTTDAYGNTIQVDNCSAATFLADDVQNYPGVMGKGVKVCSIRFEGPRMTTLTLFANVVNKYKGTSAPSDFTYSVDGVPVGLAQTVPAGSGTHTISIGLASASNGKYSRPIAQDTGLPVLWRCFSAGTTTPVTMANASDVYNTSASVNLPANADTLCALTLADPQVSSACADTAVMLATGGTGADLQNEDTAAKQLLNLFGKVTPLPQVAVGMYSASATITGQLTTTYGMDATSSASTSPRFPTTLGTPNQWTNPTNAFANNGLYATDSTSGHQEAYKTFGFNLPASANTIAGVQVAVDGYIDTSALTSTFAFQTPPAGTPASVTVSAVAKGSGAGLRFVEENGGIPTVSAAQTLTSSYATYSATFPNNPNGAAWSASDLAAAKWSTYFFGVRPSSAVAPQVTQLSVKVNYQ